MTRDLIYFIKAFACLVAVAVALKCAADLYLDYHPPKVAVSYEGLICSGRVAGRPAATDMEMCRVWREKQMIAKSP